jgi:hypothetical protein
MKLSLTDFLFLEIIIVIFVDYTTNKIRNFDTGRHFSVKSNEKYNSLVAVATDHYVIYGIIFLSGVEKYNIKYNIKFIS